MRKLFWLAVVVVLAVGIKHGIDWLGQKALEPDPITNTINQMDRARQVASTVDVHHLRTQITAFITTYGRRPTSLEEMVNMNYLPAKAVEDPWGEPYKEEWTENTLILKSKGEDHAYNTPDDLRYDIPLGSL